MASSESCEVVDRKVRRENLVTVIFTVTGGAVLNRYHKHCFITGGIKGSQLVCQHYE